jgi:hypothetical protein
MDRNSEQSVATADASTRPILEKPLCQKVVFTAALERAAHFNREGPPDVGPNSVSERFTARLEAVSSPLYDQRAESAAKNISIAFPKADTS